MVKQGDIIFVDFAPTKGREQTGERPALVVSQTAYNQKSGFVLACPITSTVKPMKIRVKLDERTKTQGDILCEQVRIVDLKERMHRTVENIPKDILQEVSNIISTLISVD
ncbi:MAG: type II toxin-antitoxin system PemK/MazF family toxin [Clostridiales Family XIII bacterium]|jgi:mRNA interferase MazF|nr:type II toxin-antitoxin system PemK/MazF family toxin [Clostridiales Family XIII bacterium]